jgi:hypothetical protein
MKFLFMTVECGDFFAGFRMLMRAGWHHQPDEHGRQEMKRGFRFHYGLLSCEWVFNLNILLAQTKIKTQTHTYPL